MSPSFSDPFFQTLDAAHAGIVGVSARIQQETRRALWSHRGLRSKLLVMLLLAPALASCGASGRGPVGIAREPLEQRTDPRESKDIPRYSWLDPEHPPGIPEELTREMQSERFSTRRAIIERELVASGSRTANGRLLPITLVTDDGVVIIPTRDGGQCLPVFSTPLAAADYTQTLLRSGPRVRYLVSTPVQFTQMLQDLEAAGVDSFTIDRCPRCPIFNCFLSTGIKSAEDVVAVWAIGKATVLAMAEFYYAYSLEAARAGRLEAARDVSLDAVSYLTLEDPRFHLLLGQVAIALRDPVLLAEARAFLRFLELPRWEQKLEEAEASKTPDFTAPEPNPRKRIGEPSGGQHVAGSPTARTCRGDAT